MSNEPERQHPKEDEMSKDREELIEVVARAVCSQYGDDPDRVGFDRHGRREEFPEWVRWKSEAQAALSAIEGAGYVVVPREPTEAMLTAMGTNVIGIAASIGEYLDYFDARGVWDAMINAYSPKPTAASDLQKLQTTPPTTEEEGA